MSSLFKTVDLFSNSQFLRFKEQREYQTASGGVVSVFVIVLLFVLFLNRGLQTARKELIQSSTQTFHFSQSTQTEIAISSQSNFMFMVNIDEVNIADRNAPRLFDFTMTRGKVFTNNSQDSIEQIGLVPCTEQHFKINQQVLKSYQIAGGEKSLCPPLDLEFNLSGKTNTQKFQFMLISVKKCTNQRYNGSWPCVSEDEVFVNQTDYWLTFSYVNPSINPQSADYLDYYLESQNLMIFSSQKKIIGHLFVEDYQINTDQSLMPYSQNKKEKGITIPAQMKQTNPPQGYAKYDFVDIWIQKGSKSTVYQRQFQKFDQYVAYVGGLVGTIIGVMFFMQMYSDLNFEISVSKILFTYEHERQIQYNFNVLYFIGYHFYKLLKLCGKGKGKRWQTMKVFQKCSEEVVNQIDISLIIKRLLFLERAVELLLKKHEYYCLHLERKMTLKQAKEKRQLHFLKRRLKQSESDKQKSQQSIQSSESEREPSCKDFHEDIIYPERKQELEAQRKSKRKKSEKEPSCKNFSEDVNQPERSKELKTLRKSKSKKRQQFFQYFQKLQDESKENALNKSIYERIDHQILEMQESEKIKLQNEKVEAFDLQQIGLRLKPGYDPSMRK